MLGSDFAYIFEKELTPLYKFFAIHSIGKTSDSHSFTSPAPINDYMITFITKGCYTFNNISSPNNPILCYQGDCLIYYPGQKFSVTNPSDIDSERIWIHCTGEIVKPILRDLKIYNKQHIKTPVNYQKSIIDSFNNLKANLLLNPPTTTSTIQYATIFLRNLARNPETQSIKKALNESMLYINQNYTSNITVSHLANMCNLSASHYSKLFKSFYKTTPHQVILDRRLSFALQQLEFTDIPITTIAENCGFNDRITFTQAFKKHFVCLSSKNVSKRAPKMLAPSAQLNFLV